MYENRLQQYLIERGGECTRTDSSNTSGNEVLPESKTTILVFTHGELKGFEIENYEKR